MTEDDFLTLVNLNWGYQAKVIIEKKPYEQPHPKYNPFVNPNLRPKELWYETRVVVGMDQIGGFIKLGEGVKFDLCWADVKKNYPNIKG